ncbi:hypothetical protein LHL11_26275, partial [Escherichia coli]|uniref:hypothetical protein n=1 Tax=Escherichia coli TaxID=562 RepID=UPI001CFB2469
MESLPASRSKSETKTESFFESKFDKRSSPEVTSATEDVFNRASSGFAPIFPDICYHLTHYKPAAADIPVASDN